MKLTRFGKVVVWLLALFAARFAVIPAAGALDSGAFRCVVVEPGDTLWSLSKARVGTDDDAVIDSKTDPRANVAETVERNRLTTDRLVPGEYLWIPLNAAVAHVVVQDKNCK